MIQPLVDKCTPLFSVLINLKRSSFFFSRLKPCHPIIPAPVSPGWSVAGQTGKQQESCVLIGLIPYWAHRLCEMCSYSVDIDCNTVRDLKILFYSDWWHWLYRPVSNPAGQPTTVLLPWYFVHTSFWWLFASYITVNYI